MPKLKANLNIIASALLLITLITVPAIVGYIHDFLSSLTHQKVIRHVEDAHIVDIYLQRYNATADSWSQNTQSWTYDPDTHKIIIPSVEQDAPTDSIIRFFIRLNASYYTGKWLWDEKIEHIIIHMSTSTNITTSSDRPLYVYAFDDSGTSHAKTFAFNKNGSDITFDIELTYTLRAWFSQYSYKSAAGVGLYFMLQIVSPTNLNGEYVELTIYFTRTEQAWVAGISDVVLGAIGVGMIIVAVFATPYVNLKDLTRLARGRRRR